MRFDTTLYHRAGEPCDRGRLFDERPFSHRGACHRFPVPGWKQANPRAHDLAYHAENGELERLGVFPEPWQAPHPPVCQTAESHASHAFTQTKRGLRVVTEEPMPHFAMPASGRRPGPDRAAAEMRP